MDSWSISQTNWFIVMVNTEREEQERPPLVLTSRRPLMNQLSAPAGRLKSLKQLSSTRSPSEYRPLRPIRLSFELGNTRRRLRRWRLVAHKHKQRDLVEGASERRVSHLRALRIVSESISVCFCERTSGDPLKDSWGHFRRSALSLVDYRHSFGVST